MDQKREQYYIYGDAILVVYLPRFFDTGTSPKFDYSRDELQQTWPQNKEVEIFRTEQDVLDYCNGKPAKPNTYYPIFLVECEKIEDSKWSKTNITFLTTMFKDTPPSSSNKKNYSTQASRVEREIDIATISSASLKQINSQLKHYYPLPESHVGRKDIIYVNDEQEDQYDYSNSCPLF